MTPLPATDGRTEPKMTCLPDRGCSASNTCFACPLPDCTYNRDQEYRRARAHYRRAPKNAHPDHPNPTPISAPSAPLR